MNIVCIHCIQFAKIFIIPASITLKVVANQFLRIVENYYKLLHTVCNIDSVFCSHFSYHKYIFLL